MNINRNNFLKKPFVITIVISMIVFILGYSMTLDNINYSFSALLENHIEVEKNSELTYYLNVSYDGVDKEGINSENGVVSKINSNIIYVEDKIPEGLIFTGFVTTGNGSIGAYKQNGNVACLGKVVDDTNEEAFDTGVWNSDNTEYTYHGLHYNAETRVVSFKIDNLQAGCVLTVGIKTITPSSLDDPTTEVVENRRDFYNFGTSREDSLSVNSNITHAYMGSENVMLYKVHYIYTGEVPSVAPSLPASSEYSENSVVGVLNDVVIDGYTFDGWTTSDVVVSNSKFIMPNKEVTFTGSFTKIDESALNKYKVMYKIEGEKPSIYSTPSTKEYKNNDIVKKDLLKKGDILGEYMFSGWTTSDVEISSDGKFEMPKTDVTFTGSFEEIKYKIEYKFYDTVLPLNSDALLPETVYVKPGEKVTLSNVINEPNGYKFLGWYYENEFIMPEENLIIYGEWKKVLGTFEPTIEQTLISANKKYNSGEEIKYKITITNNSDFEINNIMIKKYLEGASFLDENVIKESSNIVNVEKISAKSSVDLYITYIVKENDVKEIINDVEILSASSSNGYELLNKEYKVSTKALLAKELIETPITNKNSIPFVVIAIIIIVIGIGLIIYEKRRKK